MNTIVVLSVLAAAIIVGLVIYAIRRVRHLAQHYNTLDQNYVPSPSGEAGRALIRENPEPFGYSRTGTPDMLAHHITPENRDGSIPKNAVYYKPRVPEQNTCPNCGSKQPEPYSSDSSYDGSGY